MDEAPTVLVLGQLPDIHIETVVDRLEERGARTVVLDRLTADESVRASVRVGPDGSSGELQCGEDRCDLSRLTAVWWRVKPLSVTDFDPGRSSAGTRFARREWRALLDSLEFFASGARWVNPRLPHRRALSKLRQLSVARSVGLEVPPTLVTNEPDRAERFVRGRDAAIYKAMTWFYDPPDRMIFTSPVSGDEIASDPAAVRRAPCLFQTRLDKSWELRVTVVGSRIFPVRIDPGSNEVMPIDWRRDHDAVSYRSVELDEDLAGRILEMNSRLDIDFGAYDLVVRPDGEPVFLEVNPAGQWLWLEYATGAPISSAVADLLVGGGRADARGAGG